MRKREKKGCVCEREKREREERDREREMCFEFLDSHFECSRNRTVPVVNLVQFV